MGDVRQLPHRRHSESVAAEMRAVVYPGTRPTREE
jgi:hypothetical protein